MTPPQIGGDLLIRHCVRVTSSLDLDEVVNSSLDALRDFFPDAQIVVSRVEDDHVHVVGSDPPVGAAAQKARIPLGQGLAGRAAAEGRPIYAKDIRSDPRADLRMIDAPESADDRSLLAMPLIAAGRVVGTIHLLSKEPDAFSEDDRALLLALAPALAAAMNNALILLRERAARRRRRELEAQKAVFVWLTAADLRAPIARLRRIVDRMDDGDELVAAGEDLHDRCRRLSEVVEEILAVTAREQELTPKVSTFDVVAALQEVDRTEPRAPAWVQGDRVRLQWIASRLIPEGSHVRIEESDEGVALNLPPVPLGPELLDALARIAGGHAHESRLVLPSAPPS